MDRPCSYVVTYTHLAAANPPPAVPGGGGLLLGAQSCSSNAWIVERFMRQSRSRDTCDYMACWWCSLLFLPLHSIASKVKSHQHRHAADEVEREMAKVFSECRDNIVPSTMVAGVAAVDNSKGASTATLSFSTKSDFAHMCCTAELVAASMFLQRLEY